MPDKPVTIGTPDDSKPQPPCKPVLDETPLNTSTMRDRPVTYIFECAVTGDNLYQGLCYRVVIFPIHTGPSDMVRYGKGFCRLYLRK